MEQGVYIISGTDASLCKIGYTANLKKRLPHLQCALHVSINLLRFVPGPFGIERWFHERFSDYRVRSEWFKFTPEMLDVSPPDAFRDTKDQVYRLQKRVDFHGSIIPILRNLYPGRHATKKLATDAVASHRSAENWVQGYCAPTGQNLINLLVNNRDFEKEILRLIAERRGAVE